jgi:hypothetical protein
MFAATSAATNGDRVGDEVGGQEASLCKATDVLQVDGVEFRNIVLDKTANGSAKGSIARKQHRAYPRTVLAALDGNSIVHAWTVAVEARASAFVLSNQRPGLEGGMSLSSMKKGDGELRL